MAQRMNHTFRVHLWRTEFEFRKRILKLIFVELCEKNSLYLC